MSIALTLMALGVPAMDRSEVQDVPLDEPRVEERLSEQMVLDCPGDARVVEWKASPLRGSLTGPTQEGYAVLSGICRNAILSYPAFLRSLGMRFEVAPLRLSLVVLPANPALDGKEPRNMNDAKGRFSHLATGCCYWGIFGGGSPGWLYLRNDPLRVQNGVVVPHDHFNATMTHELAHALNRAWRVSELNGFDGPGDESLAVRFVDYLRAVGKADRDMWPPLAPRPDTSNEDAVEWSHCPYIDQ